jgi:hypothetical protein
VRPPAANPLDDLQWRLCEVEREPKKKKKGETTHVNSFSGSVSFIALSEFIVVIGIGARLLSFARHYISLLSPPSSLGQKNFFGRRAEQVNWSRCQTARSSPLVVLVEKRRERPSSFIYRRRRRSSWKGSRAWLSVGSLISVTGPVENQLSPKQEPTGTRAQAARKWQFGSQWTFQLAVLCTCTSLQSISQGRRNQQTQ